VAIAPPVSSRDTHACGAASDSGVIRIGVCGFRDAVAPQQWKKLAGVVGIDHMHVALRRLSQEALEPCTL